MFLMDFNSPVDEYFVKVVLRSILIIVLATFFAQLIVAAVIAVLYLFLTTEGFAELKNIFQYLDSFPIVMLGVFTVAIFIRPLTFDEWIVFLTALMITPTMYYWLRHSLGSIKSLRDFASYHQVNSFRSAQVMFPFYLAFCVDYFFVGLKNVLLPLVFILVVSDYRIILPRLVEVGLTYQAFFLFLSLFVSLHILSYREMRI